MDLVFQPAILRLLRCARNDEGEKEKSLLSNEADFLFIVL